MTCPANLRPHWRTGPSPLAVAVLRTLLQSPAGVPQIADATGLAERTVKAQITALQASDAVQRVPGGRWAVYVPVVIQP